MRQAVNLLRAVWRAICPAALPMGRRDFGLGGLGFGLGLWLTGWLSQQAIGAMEPWFIAPMGASALLLFLLPASPLAQPWSILGGNLLSALVGVSCSKWLGHAVPVAALAVALAAWGMMALRCLHPPGGAMALMAVFGGPAIQQQGYGFALGPVLVNSSLLVLVALLFNRAAGHRYPHRGAAAVDTEPEIPCPATVASSARTSTPPWPAWANGWTSSARTWRKSWSRPRCTPKVGAGAGCVARI